jgi:ParB family transcriptional regulator, chromosome partitioning protein
MDDHNLTEGDHLVEINDIVLVPGPFCMSFGFDLAPLIRSIKRVGLINNPLLTKNDRDGFDIVAGFRRILALKFLGWKTIPCRILSGAGMSPLEFLLLGLHENLCMRNFNDVEKGMILKRLSLLVDKNDILDHYMPLLNLPSHEPVLSLYLRVEDELEDKIKTSLCGNKLSLHAARLLLELERDERLGIFNLLDELIFNVNQQKQLIGYLGDIKQLSDVRILDILEDQAIRIIRYDNNLNKPQKVNAILKVLRTRISPRLIESEESFKKMLSRLNLPEGVRIVTPPYFESPDYQMVIQFRDGKELQEKIDRLSSTKGIKDIRDPWEKDS